VKVFISWSGEQAKVMAESLRSWLKLVIQSVDPFVSSIDIAKGDRGLRVIATELEETAFGIVCVTRQNSLAPWINFEAGALSKAVGESRLIPCLLDMPVSDLTGPLAQFQAVSSNSRDDILSMVRAVRDHSDATHLDDTLLNTTFDAFWPKLENDLEQARSLTGKVTTVKAMRPQAEVLEEVLVLARRQESVLRTIIERVDSPLPMRAVRRPGGSNSEKTEDRREIIDELIRSVGLAEEKALSYRIITDRVPEEIQLVYDVDAIAAGNVDDVRAHIEEFVAANNLHVTVKSADGYQIIAGPGRDALVLTPAIDS
jgi:hypothetical protein